MIIVLGSVNVDLVVRGERIPQPGETTIGGRFFQAAGGKGANQAVAAARAGSHPVVFVGAVGDDAMGHAARASLEAEHVNCQFLRTISGEPTGVALIMVDRAGENAISVASGANAAITPEHLEAIPSSVWQAARVFLASLEVPQAAIAAGLALARRHGLRTILNPAPADPWWRDAVRRADIDILTPNESEASLLSQVSIRDEASAWEASRRLRADSRSTILLTRGSLGVLEVGDSERRHAALPVDAVDTTAAGDAFNGALAAALAENQTWEHALRFAVTAAGISVTREGAQPSLPYRQEIADRLNEHGP